MDQKSYEEIRQETDAQMARIREPLFISKAHPDPLLIITNFDPPTADFIKVFDPP